MHMQRVPSISVSLLTKPSIEILKGEFMLTVPHHSRDSGRVEHILSHFRFAAKKSIRTSDENHEEHDHYE
jgi:hypothetical protein